jgi:hypothetical protein
MSTSLLFFLLVVVLVLAALVSVALARNVDVKAFCKIPFAVFSFEAKQPRTNKPNASK